MKEQLQALREASRALIVEATDMEALEALRVRYLGKKGELTAILKQMGKLSAEERPVIGQLANEIRAELENELESRKAALAKELLARREGKPCLVLVPEQFSKTGEAVLFSALDDTQSNLVELFSFTSLLRDVNSNHKKIFSTLLTAAGKAVEIVVVFRFGYNHSGLPGLRKPPHTG